MIRCFKLSKNYTLSNRLQSNAKLYLIYLSGKSIIGQSQTGSGKNYAHLLPILNEIDETKHEIQVVITAPTRELAMQIFEEIKTITELANKKNIWKTRLIVGGLDQERMMKQLKNPPHIIVGTPSRIFDLINEGALSIYHGKCVCY